MAVCFEELKKMLEGEGVPDAAIKAMLKDIQSLKETSQSLGEFRERSKMYLDDRRELLTNQRRELANNLMAQKSRNKFYQQPAFKDNPAAAVKALLFGTDRLSEGGNNSIANANVVYRDRWLGNVQISLEKAGLWKTFRENGLSKEVMQELWEMRPDGKPGVSKSAEALQIAKVLHGTQNSMLKSLRTAGLAIGKTEGYIMKQSHDAAKLRLAGGTLEESFQKWKQDILPKLDKDRTFGPDQTTKAVDERLKKSFDDIVHGRIERGTGNSISDELLTVNKVPKLANKVTASRQLHFKDATSFFDYNQAYGRKDLAESIMTSIETNAKSLALIERFGTNPRAAFEADLKRIAATLDGKAKEKFLSDEKSLQRNFNEVEGLTQGAGFSMAAKTARNARAITNMSKLTLALSSTVGDLAFAATTLRSTTGKNILESTKDMFTSFMSVIGKEERSKWAQRLEIMTEDMHGEHFDRFGAGDARQPGMIANAERVFFKFTGLPWQGSVGRVAVAKQFALELADQGLSDFGSLSNRIRANLNRYSIGEKEWGLIRNASEEVSGLKAMTPESVRQLPIEKFDAHVKENKLKTTGEKLRDKLSDQVGFYLTDHANHGQPTPTARERAVLLQGTSADEPMGVLLRLTAQFKNFPLVAHKVMNRARLSNPDPNMFGGQSDMQGMVGFVISATLLGYIGMEARSLAKGGEFHDPRNSKTWLEAFARGGSGGLYGDFLLGDYNARIGRTATGSLAGPVLSETGKAVELFSAMKSGDAKASDAFNLLANQLPGSVYTKKALDYLILDDINDALNPGFKLRQASKQAKNRLNTQGN